MRFDNLKDKAEQAVADVMDELRSQLTDPLNEDVLYRAIENAAATFRHQERYREVTGRGIRDLMAESDELEKEQDLLWARQNAVDCEIEGILRERLLETKTLGELTWYLHESSRGSGSFYIRATPGIEQDRTLQGSIIDPRRGYDYHWRHIIYKFSDGKQIQMSGDDGTYSISLDQEDITPAEFKEAFDALGITIDFGPMERAIVEQTEKATFLRNMVGEWR